MVDRAALEMRSTRKGTGGSNPSLSAILHEAMKNDTDSEQEFRKAFAAARKRTLGYEEPATADSGPSIKQ